MVQLECKVPVDDFEKLLEMATSGCHQVVEISRTVVEEHTWKLLGQRDTTTLELE